MSLERKSKQLKELVSIYDTEWFLGQLTELMHAIGYNGAQDQLGKLSSPLRQIYYLGGLLMSSDEKRGVEVRYDHKGWNKIIKLLNEIEFEYDKVFFPAKPEVVDPQWLKVRKVAMPSFLGYFNQGPLNFEEQPINWIADLFPHYDSVIENETGLKTSDFLSFYDNLDRLHQDNFQAHSTNPAKLRANWQQYTKFQTGFSEDVPDFIREMGKDNLPMFAYRTDPGMIERFYAHELVSDNLPIEKVERVLVHLTCKREQSDYLYYTSTKPGNPLFPTPIVDIGDGLYQVFEVKQVIHSIHNKLEQICLAKKQDKYVKRKGKLLEDRIVELFEKLLIKDYKIYRSYFIDGNEQDILILWDDVAFIIEAKGYSLQEPFRDPDKAYHRIKQSFDSCIGYGYEQTSRVEKYFNEGKPLKICDDKGGLIEEIDTKIYSLALSIIVNLYSFGQVQIDLSELLQLADPEAEYPWAVKLDDLETFILTLLAKKMGANDFVDFLTLREMLHGKVISNDELQICGAFISGKLTEKEAEGTKMLAMTPDLGDVFDEVYRKGLGLKNEKMMEEKASGKYLFF